MAARVLCQTLVSVSKNARIKPRFFRNARSLTVCRQQNAWKPNHCLERKTTAFASVSSYGSRHRSNLPGTDSDQLSDSEGPEEGDFDKYGISPAVQEKLRAKGITYLFPVQYETYVQTAEGWDVVVQARTGTGKTLSFGIPLVEKLQAKQSRKRGRYPKVIILEPTRELANQVAQDIKDISDSIYVACLYGGAAYSPQVQALERGLDIVIGTPGRVQDMINKGDLILDEIEHVVLDEVDRMLDMGFADSVENIIRNCYEKDEKPQTMLYSATMPPWVLKIGKRYLKNNYKHINLVGEDTVQTSTTIEHLALKCLPNQIKSLLPDIIQVHCGRHGRTIVFCQTKKECDDLASNTLHKMRAQVLHGDIAQAKRDIVIKSFKRGDHKVLITTDVASRGLDIPNVELVIQTSPPQDQDFYIHRSGRTGRAGKTGVSLLLFSPEDLSLVSQIERLANLRFKKISAPTAQQIIETSAHDVIKSLDKVLPETLEHFREPAEDLIDERGATDALAAAMAVISGATRIKSRSLLSNREGYTTYIFKTTSDIRNLNIAYRILGNHLQEEGLITDLKDLSLLKDRMGVVFDIQTELEEELESSCVQSDTSFLEKATELPEIEHVDHRFHGKGQGHRPRHGDMYDRNFGGSKYGRQRDSYFNKQGSGYPRINRPTYQNEDSRRSGGYRSRRDDYDDNDFSTRKSGGYKSRHGDYDDADFGISSDRKQNRKSTARNHSVDYDDEDFWFKR